MGMLHLGQLSRNAYRRADRIMANKPKYHSTPDKKPSNKPSEEEGNFDQIELQTRLHIFFQIDKEITLSETDKRRFDEYGQKSLSESYSQKLTFSVNDDNLIEVMVEFNYPYYINENNDIAKISEMKLCNQIETLTVSLEGDVPFILKDNMNIAMRCVRHEFRKDTIIEIISDGGVERLLYDNRVQRIKEQ